MANVAAAFGATVTVVGKVSVTVLPVWVMV